MTFISNYSEYILFVLIPILIAFLIFYVIKRYLNYRRLNKL